MKVPENECLFLFNGTPVQSYNVVGYCHNSVHRGWITKNLVKKHRCVEKECNYLEKVDCSYWDKIEIETQKKTIAKEKKRQNQEIKRRERERDEYIRSVFEPYKEAHIISISEINYDIRITISCDKWIDVKRELDMLCQKYKCAVYLRNIKYNKKLGGY